MRASSKGDRASQESHLSNVGQLPTSIANYGQGGFCKNTYNTIVQAAMHASAITVRERMAVIATTLPRLREGRTGPGCELGSPIAAILSSATPRPSQINTPVVAWPCDRQATGAKVDYHRWMCNSSGCHLSTLSGAPFACRPTKFGPAKHGSHNRILAQTHCLSKLAVIEEGIRGRGIEIDD